MPPTRRKPPNATHDGRPRLDPPDIDAIRADADRRVADALARNPDDPVAQLRTIAAMSGSARAVRDNWYDYMLKLAMSAMCHQGALAIWRSIGKDRTVWSDYVEETLGPEWNPPRKEKGAVINWREEVQRLSRHADRRGVRYYENALTELPDVVHRVVTAGATMEACMNARKPIVRFLFEEGGLNRTEIADILGYTPAMVNKDIASVKRQQE